MAEVIPEEALQAAMRHVASQPLLWQHVDEEDVRGIVEAAAPILAAQERRETARRIAARLAECRQAETNNARRAAFTVAVTVAEVRAT